MDGSICYDFKPLIDWTRTGLASRLLNGATCMRFDITDCAVFDIHILACAGAAADFSPCMRDAAACRHAVMIVATREALVRNITFGLPGSAETLTLDDMRAHLAEYDDCPPERLRGHLIDFLAGAACGQETGPAPVLSPR